jgi:hypothetical protein
VQAAAESAEKARQSSEASVSAMKSQVKGFDKELDRLLEVGRWVDTRVVYNLGHPPLHYTTTILPTPLYSQLGHTVHGSSIVVVACTMPWQKAKLAC